MQEQNLTELLSNARKFPSDKPPIVKKKMKALAVKNNSDLADKEVPDYLRLPSADELTQMRQWAIDYKKTNKKASKREIRKAVQEHFHIKIYR